MPVMPRSKLLKLLIILFIVFVALGWAVSSIYSRYTSPEPKNGTETVKPEPTEESFEGIITFIDPNLSPGDGISFSLNDSLGNEIILLKSSDQKLVVSEGLFVTVYGEREISSTGIEYLQVERVVLKNGSN